MTRYGTVQVLCGRSRRGVAVIRPPGHHAERTSPCGFCFYNNVAVAAAHALRGGLERVLVLDWDVHHGNGIQHMFEDNPQVLMPEGTKGYGPCLVEDPFAAGVY